MWKGGMWSVSWKSARQSLLRLENRPPRASSWRPQVQVLCELDECLSPKHRRFLTFVSQLRRGKGLILVRSLLEGDYTQICDETEVAEQNLKKTMKEENVKGFAEVFCTDNILAGICQTVQHGGLGRLKTNTVILGWPSGWKNDEESNDKTSCHMFLIIASIVYANENALLVLKGADKFPDNKQRLPDTIDVWWISRDCELMLLLPFLLKKHKVWKCCRVRVFSLALSKGSVTEMKIDLAKKMHRLRINAEVDVIVMSEKNLSPQGIERIRRLEHDFSKKVLRERSLGDTIRAVENVAPHYRCSSKKLPTSETVKSKDYKVGSSRTPTPPGNNRDYLAIKPEEDPVNWMTRAVRLNEVIGSTSKDAQLVLINLPTPPTSASKIEEELYMEFSEELTKGLVKVLLVRGSGKEFNNTVTTSSIELS